MKKIFFLIVLISNGICGRGGLINLDEKNEELTESISNVTQTQNPKVAEARKSSITLLKCALLHKHSDDVYKLQIHGVNISFSDIHARKQCIGKIGYLELFASNEIVINKDMIRVGKVQVVAIAPKIKVLGKREINLNGADGKEWKHYHAMNGVHGLSGKDGFGGLPGGPGGIFIGITSEIENAESLQIMANGGNGGMGQRGGDGAKGDQGEIPNVKPALVDKLLNSSLSAWKSCINITKCIVKGEDGKKGGNGGNGGDGGKAGIAGQIFVYQLNSNHLKIKKQFASDGQLGKAGMGGTGGQGGQHGGYIEMDCCEKPEKMFKENISPVKSLNIYAEPGENGIAGASVFTPKNPENFQAFRDFSMVVNDYKKFLRAHINDESRNDSHIEFYKQLISNEEINKQYETFAFLDELKGLEEQYLTLTNISDLTFWYDSLKNRIENYKQNRWNTESGAEFEIALNFAYAVAMNKANDLTRPKNAGLVINLGKFLDMMENDLDTVNNRTNTVHKVDIKIQIKDIINFIKLNIKDKLFDLENRIQIAAFELIDNKSSVNEKRDLSLKLSYQHSCLHILKVISTVETALASGALIIAETILSQKTIEISSQVKKNFDEMFSVVGIYKTRVLYFVAPQGNKGSQNKNVHKLWKNQDKFFSVLITFSDRMQENFIFSKDLGHESNEMIRNILKWNVRMTLTNLKMSLEELKEKFDKFDTAAILIENVCNSFNTLGEIYDQLETINEKQTSVTYSENVKKINLPAVLNNKKLQNAINEAEAVISANDALLQYEKAYNAFKQYAFPYTEIYFSELAKPFEHKIYSTADSKYLLYEVYNNIKLMKKKIMKDEALLNKQNIMIEHLSHKNKSSGPVYVWRNESYSKIISELLEGKEVTLFPDARDYKHNAVKFRHINFYFKTVNDKIQNSLNDKLKLLTIKMYHDGNSYYKCGEKLFKISHEAFSFTQSFEPREGESISVKEFSKGDFMVSPFAKWTVKLDLNGKSADYLKNFKNQVDVILEADASYIPFNDYSTCHLNLETYYGHEITHT